MNYDIVLLGDVCEFLDSQRVPITESDRKPGPYPYYGANGQQDSIDNYIFDEPLVLLAEDGGYFGSKDRPIAYKVAGKCWVNNHAHVLRPKSRIDIDYLHRVLSYYDVTKYINGTTRQKLTKGNAENITFPLPPLTEQKRIASLLAGADRLRQIRRTAHDLGDELLQSMFLEMFGNPFVNEKCWNKKTLRSISLKFSDGPFGSDLKTEHYVSSGVRVIRLQNIGVGKLIDDDQAYISENHFSELSNHRCLPGDVIVGTLGDPNLRAIILPPSIPQALNKADCVQIRVNPKYCNNQFICWLLNMPQTLHLATGMIHGQTRARINMGRLAELEVPIPPLSLQEEFAGVVKRVESLRARMSEAERQVEGLFESLLHESFGG